MKEDLLDLSFLEREYMKTPVEVINREVSSEKLSVILITYNHIDYIRTSIESILKQKTNFDFEIIIGDDDSSDGTQEICLEYARNYPEKIKLYLHQRENNIKVLGKPCGIFQIVYNILQSKAQYIAICSGDDYWTDPDKLQRQYECLEKDPFISLSYHSYVETEDPLKKVDFSKVKGSFPKASTMFYRNINKELPVNFLKVIQEDIFSWFILRQKGEFKFLPEIDPTVINTPLNSLSRSLDHFNNFKQVVNLNEQIYLAYKNSSGEKKNFAAYRFLYTIHSVYSLKSILYLLKIIGRSMPPGDMFSALSWRLRTKSTELKLN